MANKIAKIDNDAMNSLYGAEFARLAGHKSAQKGDAKEEQGGMSHDPQAFTDHEEYLSTLKSIMSEDTKTSGDPNDPIID